MGSHVFNTKKGKGKGKGKNKRPSVANLRSKRSTKSLKDPALAAEEVNEADVKEELRKARQVLSTDNIDETVIDLVDKPSRFDLILPEYTGAVNTNLSSGGTSYELANRDNTGVDFVREPAYEIDNDPSDTTDPCDGGLGEDVSPSVPPNPQSASLYRLNNTFIGITPFADLLNMSDVTVDGTIEKQGIAKAYIYCAAYAEGRYRGSPGDTLIGFNTGLLDHWLDIKVQHRVLLGSISLAKFLNKIHFDEDEKTTDVDLFKAFELAAAEDTNQEQEKMYRLAARMAVTSDSAL